MTARAFWLAAAALLAAMGTLEVSSAREEVQTADEAVHLVSGYSILRQGRLSLNAENPPVSKTVEALPLLALNPELPRDSSAKWQDENSVAISRPFLYRNRFPADEILFWGRIPTMLLTLAFGTALAAWTRFRFGWKAALIALALYCFDPNFIAHGRYVTSDVYGACFFFLGAIAWGELLQTNRMPWAIAASLLTAIGICTKFNLLLLPLVIIGMTLLGRRKLKYFPWRALTSYLLLIPPAIWAIYGFELRTVASDRPAARFLNLNSAQLAASPVLPRPAVALLDPARQPGAAIHWMATRVPIPAYSFFKGLYRLYNHDYWGHTAYLLGRVSDKGWWWYFPLAFLVKTPTGTLLLLILAAIAGRGVWRGIGYPAAFLLGPPAIYFAAAMAGRIDIGIRHILPIYPFLFVLIAVVAANVRGLKLTLATVALSLAVMEPAFLYPDYLAFFNWPSGGPAHGATYLVDSNLDWGQDVLKLKRYLEDHRLQSIGLRYFGSADLDYYGIRREPLEDVLRSPTPRLGAISATALEMDPAFARLRRCTPIERVGWSIYIYNAGAGGCGP